jgi:hypothetical protein
MHRATLNRIPRPPSASPHPGVTVGSEIDLSGDHLFALDGNSAHGPLLPPPEMQ